jgi:hypothetical protein
LYNGVYNSVYTAHGDVFPLVDFEVPNLGRFFSSIRKTPAKTKQAITYIMCLYIHIPAYLFLPAATTMPMHTPRNNMTFSIPQESNNMMT